MLVSLLWACTAVPSALSPPTPAPFSCVAPALVTHQENTLAVHRVAEVEGTGEPHDAVTDGWVAPGSGEAVISVALASRLGISVGDAMTTAHQLPNGAADINTYTTTAIASVQPGFEMTVFVVQPADKPCRPYVLTTLPSPQCTVMLNSPKGAALAAVMPRPASVSLSPGQVALSANLVQALDLKAGGPVLLTTAPLRQRVFEVAMVDELQANDVSRLYLSEGEERSYCESLAVR